MEMTNHDIRVHGWFSNEHSYVGTGTDVTAWIESLDDAQITKIVDTFELAEQRNYEFEDVIVRLNASVFDGREDTEIPPDITRAGSDVLAPMEIDNYELCAYIRFNRPALRDRLKLCGCAEIRKDGRACHCDATVQTPISVCSDCESGEHNFKGRA